MNRTTRDPWWEDRQEVLDRRYRAVWWYVLNWMTATGLAAALFLWGWRSPVVLVITGTALAALVLVPSRPLRGSAKLGRLDDALVVGLTTTGAVGLLAILPGWGLVALLLLAGSAPPARRFGRDARAVLRWSLAAAEDARPRPR